MAAVAAIQGDAHKVEKFHKVSKEDCSVLQHWTCNLDDKKVGLYKLGPFVDVSMAEEFAKIRDAYPSTNRKILLEDASSFNGWGHWGRHTPTKSWPNKDKNFISWVNRMVSNEAIKAKWKELRIYEAILTCTYPLTYDPVLMTSLICFWNSVTNSFYFPEGMMSVTIEDVMALLNASPTGVPLDPLTCGNKKTSYVLPKDRFHKEITSYSKVFEVEKKNGTVISKQEEVAFYLYWLSKYIVCTRSVQLQKSLIPLAETIQEADKPVALAPFVLGLIYHCLNSSVRRDFSPGVTGPLWIVQLWAYAYFPDVALLPLPREGTAICYGTYYIQCQPKKPDRDLRGCINQLLSKRERTAIEWMPWCKREFGADWFKNFVDRIDLSEEQKAFWQSILTPRDLAVYCTSADIFLEPYSPNQWARQLGHTQCIPIPFFQTMNRPWEMRERVRDNQLQGAATILQDISQNATFRSIMWAPNEDRGFLDWWTKYFGNMLQKIPENLDILAQHFGGLEQIEAPEEVQTLKRKVQTQKEQERPRKKKGRKSSVAGLLEESEKLQSLKKLSMPKSGDLPSKKKGKKIIVLAVTNEAEKMHGSKRKVRTPEGPHPPNEKRGKAVLDGGPTNEVKKSNRLKRKVRIPEAHDPPSKKRGKKTVVGQPMIEPEPSVEDSPILITGVTIEEHAVAPADSPVPETKRRRRKSTQEQIPKPLLQTSSSQEQDPSILRATGVIQEHTVAPADSPIPVIRRSRRKSTQAPAPKPLLQRHEDIEKEVEKQPVAQDASAEEDEEGTESIANMILQCRRNGEIRSRQPRTSPQQATISSNEDDQGEALNPPAMESTPREKGAEENVEQGNGSSPQVEHPPLPPSTATDGDLSTEDTDSQLSDPSQVEEFESREQQLQLAAPHHHLEHHANEGLNFPMEVDNDQISTLKEQWGSSAFLVTTEATTNEGEQALIVDISPGFASEDLTPLPQTNLIDQEATGTRVLSPCTNGPHNFQNQADINSQSTDVIQAVLKLKELLQKNIEIICTTSDISTLCSLLSELASKSPNIVQMKYLKTAAQVIKELRKSVPKLLSYLNSSGHTEQEKLEQEIKELEAILTTERGNERACKAEIQQVDKEIEALILKKVELETRNEFQQAYVSAHERELQEKQKIYDQLHSDQGYSSSLEANVELSSIRAKWSAVSSGLLEYL